MVSSVRTLLRRHFPPEGQIQLLTAALADPELARQAWRQWKAGNDLALADHAEVRLLAAVAGRIREIEPDLPLDPRLEGMRRYIWAVNQVTFSATRPLLTAMREAGLRLMLLKGAARLAADPGLAKQRAARDIDVLIRPDEWQRAVDAVLAAGWRNSLGDNDEMRSLTTHAVGLSGPHSRLGGEFDLHRFAIRQNQCRNHDLGLWERAQQVEFLGVNVLCPSPTDQAIVTLSQASLFNRGPHPAHWALDIAAFARADQIDWSQFLHEVHFRRIELFVAAPLLLLRERLQVPVPDHVLDDLTRPIGAAYRIEFETRTKNYRPKTPEAVKASRIVAGARAMRLARSLGHSGSAAPPASTIRAWWLGPDQRLVVPVPAGMRPFARLRVEISFQAWHAASGRHLRVMSQNVTLVRIPVARASRTQSGRIRYKAVFRVPACLLTMSGGGKLSIRTDGKLRVRDLRVRFGAPAAENVLAELGEALRARLAKWLSVRRRSAAPASP